MNIDNEYVQILKESEEYEKQDIRKVGKNMKPY